MGKISKNELNTSLTTKIEEIDLKANISDLETTNSQLALHVQENSIDAHAMIPAVSIKKSSGQSIPNSTVTQMTFDIVEYDSDNMKINSTQLQCKTAGKYLIVVNTFWGAGTIGHRLTQIGKNGVSFETTELSASPNGFPAYTLTTITDLQIGDYIDIHVKHDQGVALIANANVKMIKVGWYDN